MSHLVQFDILLGLPPTEQPDDLVETEKSQGTTWVKSWITNVFSNSGTSESPPPEQAQCTEKEISKLIRRSSIPTLGEFSLTPAGEIKTTAGSKPAKTERNYWMSDSSVRNCFDCGKSFSTIRRRHHCRFCGQIFCWKCAPVRAPPVNKRSCEHCLKIQRNPKTPPQSPYDAGQAAKNKVMRKTFLQTSSINLNFDDLVVINCDTSSDNRDNLNLLFRDFQSTEARNSGSSFSGERLLSWLSAETSDHQKSIGLANRMLELNLFNKVPKTRHVSFIPTEGSDGSSGDGFELHELYRGRPQRRATTASSNGRPGSRAETQDEFDFSSIRSPSALARRASVADGPPTPFQVTLGTDGRQVSFHNEKKERPSSDSVFLPIQTEEINEPTEIFHDPCLSCISPSYLKDFLGHHGCFVVPKENMDHLAGPLLNPTHCTEVKSQFDAHLQRVIDFLLSGLAEKSKAAWRNSLITKVPAIAEHIDHESLHPFFDVRKIVHVKKVISDRKSGQIEITNGVGLSGRVIKTPAERHRLKTRENVQD